MGCDWYSIGGISAFGVIIEDNELIIEIQRKIVNNMEYEMMLFRQSEGTRCFVYKKETKTFISGSVPGPYEIDSSDNFTEIVVNEKMTNLLKDDKMEEFLEIKDCKYLSILTTFGVGKGFSSIQEYNDYYGYE
jgi:hypothetical protein